MTGNRFTKCEPWLACFLWYFWLYGATKWGKARQHKAKGALLYLGLQAANNCQLQQQIQVWKSQLLQAKLQQLTAGKSRSRFLFNQLAVKRNISRERCALVHALHFTFLPKLVPSRTTNAVPHLDLRQKVCLSRAQASHRQEVSLWKPNFLGKANVLNALLKTDQLDEQAMLFQVGERVSRQL